jgi:hypothetical protein
MVGVPPPNELCPPGLPGEDGFECELDDPPV